MIIFRYLLKQLLSSTFAVCSVMLLVFMSARFVRYLADAVSGKYDAGSLLAMIGFRLPEFLEMLLPLSFFISILLVYGRLYMDSEMTVLSACGMSRRRLLGYTTAVAAILAVAVGFISLEMTPAGTQKFADLERAANERAELDAMPTKRFQSLSSKGGVAYAEEVSNGRLSNVFYAESSGSDGSQTLILARSGKQDVSENGRENYLVLEKGVRLQITPGEHAFSATSFEEFGQRLKDTKNWLDKDLESRALSSAQLWESPTREHQAVLHWRLTLPLMVIVVAILAVPLSRTNPRQGRYLKLLPAILIYMVYLLALRSGQEKVVEGELGVITGIWGVHFGFLLFAWLMYSWTDLVQSLTFSSGRRAKSIDDSTVIDSSSTGASS